MSSQEWKKEIAKCFNQDSGMSPEEAKIAFLKVRLFRLRDKCIYLYFSCENVRFCYVDELYRKILNITIITFPPKSSCLYLT